MFRTTVQLVGVLSRLSHNFYYCNVNYDARLTTGEIKKTCYLFIYLHLFIYCIGEQVSSEPSECKNWSLFGELMKFPTKYDLIRQQNISRPSSPHLPTQ